MYGAKGVDAVELVVEGGDVVVGSVDGLELVVSLRLAWDRGVLTGQAEDKIVG